ncbi:MAG: 16S rRNA (cytidine(1402)-2'-O)-methyltransferase [Clostridia bacterium]|nr:16S rRNA (cytidine(1402)-2'-O)-methyltransferase [Clostridia bacterium]
MAKLYIVGTPIGNLKDITLRAIETLKMVDFIACEDTRHSLQLLNHLEITKPLFAYHQHNENQSSEKICALVREGKNVALITDAGMPSVSDPGAIVVSKCRQEGLEVETVPSATALTTAFALSGIQSKGFAFLGFIPSKQCDKVRFLSKYSKLNIPMAFYCAPHDIIKDAQSMLEVFGDRRVWVAKELTKIHESVLECTLANFCIGEPRGEYVLIVDGATEENKLLDLTIEEHLDFYIEQGNDSKTAVKLVSSERGLNKNEVYQIALKMKQ